eukprot:scaffold2996_cov102-Cylindrotheca_fusiformis.AAC.1
MGDVLVEERPEFLQVAAGSVIAMQEEVATGGLWIRWGRWSTRGAGESNNVGSGPASTFKTREKIFSGLNSVRHSGAEGVDALDGASD